MMTSEHCHVFLLNTDVSVKLNPRASELNSSFNACKLPLLPLELYLHNYQGDCFQIFKNTFYNHITLLGTIQTHRI